MTLLVEGRFFNKETQVFRQKSRSPNSWMRQCPESELDGEFLLVADPSECKSTPRSDKVVVTFEQKLHHKIFVPKSPFQHNFELNFGTILAKKFT